MRCIDCKCCKPVKYQRYIKATNSVNLVTVQKCFGVAEPFEILDVHQECKAYAKEYWNNKETPVNKETVELPLSIGDVYYTNSLVFSDFRNESGENKGCAAIKPVRKQIKNKSDIYEYMMLHERGSAFLTEKEAKKALNKIKI